MPGKRACQIGGNEAHSPWGLSANPAYRQSWATFGQNHSTKIRRTNVNRFGPVLLENIAMKVALADLL